MKTISRRPSPFDIQVMPETSTGIEPMFEEPFLRKIRDPQGSFLTFDEMTAMMEKDPILKAIVEDRIQDVAEGRTSKWTRRRPGSPGFEIKPKEG